MFKTISKIPRKLVGAVIKLYQLTLSPDHGLARGRYPAGFCRHYPSCSEYSRQAILKYGVVKGGWQGLRRIARCNPWVQPSVDPIN
jgi:putative membrane protein insertion efficiency factor